MQHSRRRFVEIPGATDRIPTRYDYRHDGGSSSDLILEMATFQRVGETTGAKLGTATWFFVCLKGRKDERAWTRLPGNLLAVFEIGH